MEKASEFAIQVSAGEKARRNLKRKSLDSVEHSAHGSTEQEIQTESNELSEKQLPVTRVKMPAREMINQNPQTKELNMNSGINRVSTQIALSFTA